MNPVILAGDLYCWIEKMHNRSKAAINFLQEEGLTIINSPRMVTYTCQKGASAINFIFYDSCLITVTQEGLWKSATTPFGKHIPIVTSLSLVTQ